MKKYSKPSISRKGAGTRKAGGCRNGSCQGR